MNKIAYFGFCALPEEGKLRKLMYFTQCSDRPGLLFMNGSKPAFTEDEFRKKFIEEGNVCELSRPATILIDESLYINHKGTLLIADSKDSQKNKKMIGHYDETTNQSFHELEGAEDRE